MKCDICGEEMEHAEHKKKAPDYQSNFTTYDTYICPNCCFYVETVKIHYKIEYILDLEEGGAQ